MPAEPIFVLRGGYYPKYSPRAYGYSGGQSGLGTHYESSGTSAGISATTVKPTLNASRTFSLLGDYIYYRGLRTDEDGALSYDNEQELYQRYENSASQFEQEDIINSTAQDLNAGLISAIQAQYGRGIQHTTGALTYEEEAAALGRPRAPRQAVGGNPIDVMRARGTLMEVTYQDFWTRSGHHGIYGTRGRSLQSSLQAMRGAGGSFGPVEGPRAAERIASYFRDRINQVFNPAIQDMKTMYAGAVGGAAGRLEYSGGLENLKMFRLMSTTTAGGAGGFSQEIRAAQMAEIGMHGQLQQGRRFFHRYAEDFVKKALGGFHAYMDTVRGGVYHSFNIAPYEHAVIGPWLMHPIGSGRAFEFQASKIRGEYVAGYGGSLAFEDNLSNGMTTHEGALRGFGAISMHRAGITNTNIQVQTVEKGGMNAVGTGGIEYRAYTDTMIAGKKLNRWIAGLVGRMRDTSSVEAQAIAGQIEETLTRSEFGLTSQSTGVPLGVLEQTFWAAPWVGVESFQRQVMHMQGA